MYCIATEPASSVAEPVSDFVWLQGLAPDKSPAPAPGLKVTFNKKFICYNLNSRLKYRGVCCITQNWLNISDKHL